MEKIIKNIFWYVRENPNKWRVIGYLWIASSISSLQIDELEVILIKIQIDIFMKLDKLILRFMWNTRYKDRQDLFDECILHSVDLM